MTFDTSPYCYMLASVIAGITGGALAILGNGQALLAALAMIVAVLLAIGLSIIHRAELGRLAALRRQAELRLEVALAGIPVVLSEQDRDLRYTWVAGSVVGLPVQHLVGCTAADLFDTDSRRRLDEIKKAVVGNGVPQRVRLTLAAPGGIPQVFDSYFEPRLDRNGAVVGVIGRSVNITAEQQGAAALRTARQQLDLAAEMIGFGSFDWNIETGSISLSGQARVILGLPPEGDVPPAALARLIHPDDRALVERQTGRSQDPDGDGVLAVKYRIRLPDGQERWLEMRGRTLFHGSTGRWACRQIGAIRDVSASVQAEQSMRAAEAEAEAARRSKSRFMAAASHDLRQPLQALNLYFSVLAARISPPEAMVMARIEDCVGRLNDLLGHMVDLNKLDAGVVVAKPRGLALLPLMRRAAATYGAAAAAKGIGIRVVKSAAKGWTDPVLMERVLANLLSNAVRYTAKGGILIGCRRRQGRLWLEVHDTGIGIPDDKIGEIFEEFKQIGNDERNPENGRGLGLAIVKRIAGLLGVEIRVWSRLGLGSVFAIEVASESNPLFRPRPLSCRPLNTPILEESQPEAGSL